jgi:phage terminase large subunit
VADCDEQIAKETIPYFGVDWGFSKDPTTLVKSYFIDDNKLYIQDERWVKGCPIEQLPDIFGGVKRIKEGLITADNNKPEIITYLKKRGFNIRGAKKGAGSIEAGVVWLQDRKIIVHPRCEHMIHELKIYSYKVDLRTEQILPVLADRQEDHMIDALRYAHESSQKKVNKVGAFNMSVDID